MRTILAFAFRASAAIAAVLSLAAAPIDQAPMKRHIDAIFAPIAKPGAPGLAVLVKYRGQVLFLKGYGVSNLRSGAMNTPDTNFRLASFSKQFTAMAVMLCVRDGKLHYEDRLTDIFPDFPPYGKTITVRHLLTHTSGLLDYEDLMDRAEKAQARTIWSPERQIQDEEVLQLLEQAPAAEFAAGTKWAYSNSGYVVLGLIVAKVSGMSYGNFLQERIFAPAGMRRSVVYQKGIHDVSNRAFGHSLENGKWTETDQSSTSATLGDGGVYSNLEDLAKWDEALANHTLLSEQEMAPALRPVKLSDGSETRWPVEQDGDNLAPGKPVSYGFGWFLDPRNGHTRMWHTGSTIGFRTVIQRFPAERLTIVILANRADVETKALSDQIADLVLAAK
jgi:CubicO group peptidase (beta-lactamase class C family)